jgi:hypothetical protein
MMDAQAAWNEFVIECAHNGFVLSRSDTPTGYEVHGNYSPDVTSGLHSTLTRCSCQHSTKHDKRCLDKLGRKPHFLDMRCFHRCQYNSYYLYSKRLKQGEIS